MRPGATKLSFSIPGANGENDGHTRPASVFHSLSPADRKGSPQRRRSADGRKLELLLTTKSTKSSIEDSFTSCPSCSSWLIPKPDAANQSVSGYAVANPTYFRSLQYAGGRQGLRGGPDTQQQGRCFDCTGHPGSSSFSGRENTAGAPAGSDAECLEDRFVSSP